MAAKIAGKACTSPLFPDLVSVSPRITSKCFKSPHPNRTWNLLISRLNRRMNTKMRNGIIHHFETALNQSGSCGLDLRGRKHGKKRNEGKFQ